MHVGGFLKNTLVDFPGRIASTIFLSGCNFHCGFCHNPELVSKGPGGVDESIDLSEIFDYLKRATQRGFLDGVCITGGEPTLYKENLKDLMVDLKNLGLAIKLDTNGSNPQLLSQLPIDYLALDLKTSLNRYGELTRIADIENKIRESISFLQKQNDFKYEFRTTLVPSLVTIKEISDLGSLLNKNEFWFFQNFRNTQVLDPFYLTLKPYDLSQVHELVALADQYTTAALR